MSDGIYNNLGHPIPARASAQMAADREPLLSGPVPLCATPGCLRDVRAEGLCIECLEVREIARPYGQDYRRLKLAEECACLVLRDNPETVVTPCEAHRQQAERREASDG